MNWQNKLGTLFAATVNQGTLEEASELMVFVSSDDIKYHNECIAVLESAIMSCSNHQTDSISAINKSGYRVNSIDSAKELLNEFLIIYLNKYHKGQ